MASWVIMVIETREIHIMPFAMNKAYFLLPLLCLTMAAGCSKTSIQPSPEPNTPAIPQVQAPTERMPVQAEKPTGQLQSATTTPLKLVFKFYSTNGPWKTYAVERMGLSFSYPGEWNVDDDQRGNLVILDNVKPNDIPARGGMPDGAVKIDIQNLAGQKLNDVLDCGKNIEGSVISCKDTMINGVAFRKMIVASEIEGDHKEVVLAAKTKTGVLSAIGFAPAGKNQENAVAVIERIFAGFKLK